MASLFPAPQQYFDNNGDPLSGGKVYFYEAGTTTPKNTFTDQGGATPNANPVILDSAGRASIWGTGSYKEVVRTSADVLISTKDSVTLGGTIDAGTVTNAMLADMAANTVKVRASSTSGVPSDVALAANQFLGRDGSNNISGINIILPTLPHRSGAYYPPSNAIGSATTAVGVTANEIQAFPFIVPVQTTYTRLSIHVTTAGTNNMRLGIYSDSAGVPSALVLDAGTVSVASIGDKEITISQTLSAGLYWLVFLAQSNGSQIRAFVSNTHYNIVGGNDLTGGFYPALRRASFTYAPLPNPFGGTPAGTGNNVAMICLKV